MWLCQEAMEVLECIGVMLVHRTVVCIIVVSVQVLEGRLEKRSSEAARLREQLTDAIEVAVLWGGGRRHCAAVFGHYSG